jgi:hypothetical protein
MPSTPEKNELARKSTPPTTPLRYFSPSGKSATARLLPSIGIATFCFAAAHLLAECLTGYLATFEFYWLGPASNPHRLEKLRDQYLFNIFVELVWLVPATALVFLIQLAIGFYHRDALQPPKRRVWAIGVALGVCYCWARWGLWALAKSAGFPFTESDNFFASMFFAAVAGAVLAGWQRT